MHHDVDVGRLVKTGRATLRLAFRLAAPSEARVVRLDEDGRSDADDGAVNRPLSSRGMERRGGGSVVLRPWSRTTANRR